MGGAISEKALGDRLQLARKRAGLTQQELCNITGLSYSTLAKIERGAIKTPSVFTVATIAEATNTSVEELLGLKGKVGITNAHASEKKVSKSGVRFVYFDVNGVLVRFFYRAFSKIAQDTGVSADVIETIFWRHNDAACRGQLSLEALNNIFAKELRQDSFDWQGYYMAGIERTPDVSELITWASQHYEVGLLSNSMGGFIEHLRSSGIVPNIAYTAVVDSSKVGTTKPDAKIYEIASQLAAVEPHEILLVDDTRANLIAADRAGWHNLWFDDYHPSESVERVRQSLAF
jgi:putative hydrolase of the HAD superfamily